MTIETQHVAGILDDGRELHGVAVGTGLRLRWMGERVRLVTIQTSGVAPVRALVAACDDGVTLRAGLSERRVRGRIHGRGMRLMAAQTRVRTGRQMRGRAGLRMGR